MNVTSLPAVGAVSVRPIGRTPIGVFAAYCRRNPQLAIGAAMILALLMIGLLGPLFVDTKLAQPTNSLPQRPPSWTNPLGTDDQGRDLLAALVVGVPLTLRVGFVAGAAGLGVGIILGLLAGFRGGWVDTVISIVVDTFLTIPALLVLIMIAASIKGFISVTMMGLIIASLAWMYPTRAIRSQVLTLRQRGYVQVARLSGLNTFEIIIQEVMPNMLPYMAAAFVGAVSNAVLASIGLEVLGLGPQNEPTLGMTIYWAITFNAVLRELWWWWVPPILVVIVLFVGLFLLSTGLDEIANPRKRKLA